MTASQQITDHIASLDDWKRNMLTALREVIHAADPTVVEEWKWSTPVYSHDGLVCATGDFKDHVKLNFFKGADLADQSLFNAGLESKKTRAIDFRQDDSINVLALSTLVRAAIELNK
jgi:hypothetical protein